MRMKNVMLSTCLALAATAGALAAPNDRPASIAAVVAQSGGTFDTNNSDFDILLTALQTANLVAPLSDANANLTVFAPNDAAFIQTAKDLGFTGTDETGAWNFLVGAFTTLGSGDPVPPLTNVLKYHVLPQRIGVVGLVATEATDANIPTLLAGSELRFSKGTLIDSEPDLINPRIIAPNAALTRNGRIHVINRVLFPLDLPGGPGLVTREPTPGTIGAVVFASGPTFDTDGTNFNILYRALGTANLFAALSDRTSKLTVFAPNDAAFVRTARDLGYTGTDESGAWTFLVGAFTTLGNGDPVPVLTNVLLYHVVGRQLALVNIQNIDLRGRTIQTLLSGATINPNGLRLVDKDPQITDPRITATRDLRVRNGIIHVINRVLLPIDVP